MPDLLRAAALLAIALVSQPAHAQWMKSRRDLQHEAAQRNAPVQIALRPESAPLPMRTFKVRIYATSDHRALVFQWTNRIRNLVERVNHTLARWPRVRFEIEEVRPWEHDSSGENLKQLLGELEALDPGTDVDWVIGLGGALSTMPDSIDAIGMARLFGRHFVMRSADSIAEENLFRETFDELSAEERTRLTEARKAHRELIIFLHEWAHTLGLIHAQHYDRIMNPSYTRDQFGMSETDARLVEIGLDARGDLPRWRRALQPIVEDAPDADWDPRDRQLLTTWVHPQSANVAPQSTNVAPQPERASKASTAALFELAASQLRDHADADATMTRIEAELVRTPSSAGWRAAAGLRQQAMEPTLAIADAAHASRYEGEAMKSWSIRARRRWAIPFDAGEHGLTPDHEGDYARTLTAGMQAITSKQLDGAEAALRALGAAYPLLPGPAILRCALALARHGRSKDLCHSAAARQEDAIFTQLLLADEAARAGNKKLAASLRLHAAELDE
jgi:Matrixin